MTTLNFADGLVENTFSFGNIFTYDEKSPYGLCFAKDSKNYPFILKGGKSDDFILEYMSYPNQLRGRLLNTKKIKEVMDVAKIPLYFRIKHRSYLIGKGFLSTYDDSGNHKLLFIACVDGTKNITSIDQVKFYVSKDIYLEFYKAVQPAIKDIIAGHTGDIIMCKNILDYIGEKIELPKGVSLPKLNEYKEAVVRTCLTQGFLKNTNLPNEPLVVESNRGTVGIEQEDLITAMAVAVASNLAGRVEYTRLPEGETLYAPPSIDPSLPF